MQSFNFIERIKFYSVLSFLVPLIAINSCFALYKFIGDFDTSLDFAGDLGLGLAVALGFVL